MAKGRKSSTKRSKSEDDPGRPLPDTRPRFIASHYFRGASDPLIQAFLHVEKLREGRLRKLPAEEWDQEFKAFLEAERR